MKRIMLIGPFNITTQNMKQLLGKEYQVQLASDNTEMIIGMLEMEIPDLILVSVTGMEKEHRKIFVHIQKNYPDIPVIYVGTMEELEMFEDFGETDQFYKIVRPVQLKTISQAILDRLEGFPGQEEAKQRAPWEKKRVFVIDDSRIQRNMLKNLLCGHYSVDDAASGKEAFQKIAVWQPDLILLDYDMPEQDGKEIFEKLQKDKRYCDIPVVFLTGVKEKEKIQAVLGLIPAGYLLKPVEQSKLMQVLKEQIGI